MKLFARVSLCAFLCLFISSSAFAQADDNPFLLKRGDNEFGFWGGFSPQATTIFGGLRDDEAEDRKFVIAAFRYGRTLAANDSLALQYTLDATPLVVATGTIISRTTVGGVRRAVSIGLRFHHISNGDRTGSNRGLNQFVIYAGFSIFK